MKRTALQFAVFGVTLLAMACSQINACSNSRSENFKPSAPAPTTNAAATTAGATAVSTSTAASGATATASGTGTSQTFQGSIKLGYDHPPFAQTYTGTGNSFAIVCGLITGAPGGTVTIGLSGGTGQPTSVTATLGADNKFTMPFPIMQFGMLTATVTNVKSVSGATLTGSIQPVTLEVKGGADVACTP